MRARGAAVLGVLAVAAAACGDAPDRAERSATAVVVVVAVDTVNGEERVRISGEPRGWTLESELRLGAEDGGAAEFGRVRALLADGDGNVYVAESLAREIRVFAPDGRHLRSIGRRGRGPGEFEALSGIAWVGGGELAALDPGNARIGVLSPTGEWLRTWRHFPITGAPADVRLFPDRIDAFYARGIDPRTPGRPALQRFTAEGAGEPFAAPRAPEGAPATSVVCHTSDGGITFLSIQDAPRFVYALGRERRYAASWTDRYRIALLSPEGDTLRVVEREAEPVPYSDAAWQQHSAPYRALRARFPGAECEPSAPERPASRAALRHLLFDEEGRLWVEAATPAGFAWDVFDGAGRLLASAPAPERQAAIPPYVRGGRLYQVETDSLDVQRVGVYRLVSRAP